MLHILFPFTIYKAFSHCTTVTVTINSSSLFVVGKGWPLNYHFIFDLLCVGAVGVAFISLLLPKSIEVQRKRKLEDTSEQETA